MSKSKTDIVIELQGALEDGRYSKYLKLLSELASGNETLMEKVLKKAVLEPLQRVVGSPEPADWWGRLSRCGVANEAANLVAGHSQELADQLKVDVRRHCSKVLSGCEADTRPIVQQLVYELDKARHEKSLKAFDRFLGSFGDVERMASQPRWSNSTGFLHYLKELRGKSEIVFSELIASLTHQNARSYRIIMDMLPKLSDEHRSRLNDAISVLDHERILEEFDVGRFESLPVQDAGVKTAVKLRELLDQKLFKTPLSAESDSKVLDSNESDSTESDANESHNKKIVELNKELISTFKDLDGHLDKFFPKCTRAHLEDAYGLKELSASIGKWLTQQTAKSDVGILEEARSIVRQWKGWDLAGKRILSDEGFDKLMNESQASYEAGLFLKAMDLLGDAGTWQADGLKEWEEVGRHCGPVIPPDDQDNQDDLEKWTVWHLAKQVLGKIHAVPPDYKSTLLLLSESDYRWQTHTCPMTVLIAVLKRASANVHSTANGPAVKNRHATMLAEIIDILQLSGNASKNEISRKLEDLVKGDPSSVFKELLGSYTHDAQELGLWQKLAAATSKTEIIGIRRDLSDSDLAEMEDLAKAVDLAVAIVDGSHESTSSTGATEEKKRDPLEALKKFLAAGKKILDDYSALSVLLRKKGLPVSSVYQKAAAGVVGKMCDHVEELWKDFAIDGNPGAIKDSLNLQDSAINWTERSEPLNISREENRQLYSRLSIDATVRKHVGKGNPLDAIEAALSDSEYEPDREIGDLLRKAVSSVSCRDLTAEQLNGLLGWNVDWGDKALRVIADGCFQHDDIQLLDTLGEVKGPLPDGYYVSVKWHRWWQKKDPNDSCLDVFAAMKTGEIPEPLESAVSEFLEYSEDQPLLCLVWQVIGAKIAPQSSPPKTVVAALRKREEVLSGLEKAISQELPKELKLDSFGAPYDEFSVSHLMEASANARDRFAKDFETWRERGGKNVVKAEKAIDVLERDIRFLVPQWESMITMLTGCDLKSWLKVEDAVTKYSEKPGSRTYLVNQTLRILTDVTGRIGELSDRITGYNEWLKGSAGSAVCSTSEIDQFERDLARERNLVRNHSDATPLLNAKSISDTKPDLDQFIASLREAVKCLSEWERFGRSFFSQHKEELGIHARSGEPYGEAASFLAWWDEMHSKASDPGGIYKRWLDNWKSGERVHTWTSDVIPGLRKTVKAD